MGIWTGIKHALNSTLGTEYFKPLDKIVKEQVKLSASENTLFYLGTLEAEAVGEGSSSIVIYPKKIKMETSGTFNIYGVPSNEGVATRIGRFRVSKNNYAIISKEYNYSDMGEAFSELVSFSPGDVFSFSVYVKNGSSSSTAKRKFSVSDLSIKADSVFAGFDLI